MKLRWMVEREENKTWCDRNQEWENHEISFAPVLQYYSEEEDTWMDVPTKIIKY